LFIAIDAHVSFDCGVYVELHEKGSEFVELSGALVEVGIEIIDDDSVDELLCLDALRVFDCE